MASVKGENLRSVYVLLFLYIAFFFLEHEDPGRYAALFSFERDAVLSGEVWRLFTFQFTQSGQGWFNFPKAVVLFFTLLLLYIMGSAIEEVWGTSRFLVLFVVSTLATAVTAGILGVTILGSYFVNFSLLFVYAALFPQQTFYMFAVIPVRIRWIGWIAAFVLVSGVMAGSGANTAALAGAVAAWAWFLAMRVPTVPAQAAPGPDPVPQQTGGAVEGTAVRNAARFVAVRKAVAAQSGREIDRLATQFERDVIAGVNICPPADFKPESLDGYCIRCEGFSECSIRFLTMNRPAADSATERQTMPEPSA